MGFDNKANDTVIHHIGAAKDGARGTAGDGNPKRDAQDQQARATAQEVRDRAGAQDGEGLSGE
jgi:hypothetical protein